MYVFLLTSIPLHNGGGYVSGALLNPLMAIPHDVGPTSLLRRHLLTHMQYTWAC
jgi:hypothetical protein